ncbi:hypothetical protein JANAI62_04450 [Jannaschia pagri]|uniref:Tetratricopeptide repeat-containing protein n=1 Tax=Jannaschia pagri TaxID=2829797 RepID=A0ABQ4NIB2_9RHOB|nr:MULTISPECIES: tetratricopeptide repeat protein [unclassified Jannaschia]GIT90072.1 hypothetical protein JANAI61_05300 [Jannaschia sp. AI_61]GIT93822.1 hypothetical protein JANAI62_04450 [Jannaschia sp. AI_62]
MIRSLLLSATLSLSVTLPQIAQAQGLAGPYLAARIAGYSNDYAAAANYYNQLLARGVSSPRILENAVVIYAALGNVDRAAQAAEALEAGGFQSQFADGAKLVSALTKGDYDEALGLLDERGVSGALLDGLIRAWITAADDDPEGVAEAFDALAQTAGFAPLARIHHAYALAMAGDFEGADDILSGRAHGTLNLTTRGIEAHAQVLMELGRDADATELLARANGATNSPVLQSLAERIEAGDDVGWSFITQVPDGLAEAYFTLAAIFAGETSSTFTLLSARAANALRPDHLDALVLTAELLEEQDRFTLANDVLNRVPRDHPSFFGAEITRAGVLLSAGKDDASVEVLSALTKTNPDRQVVWSAFGDTLRRLDRFQESSVAYERAIDLIEEESDRDWYLYYVRGITYERTDRWALAEADFRKALELNPDHPQVLNYLGYGLVEKRIKLDEALDMIERAVEARPEDGYITDSLAWVLYRLGRFEEAVEPMERAVDLAPLDPTINDHLGDVLWVVGRKREAEFQWHRALSLEPETEEDVKRIRRKLEVGLDVVLEEEGGVGPIEAAQD